MKLDSSFIAPAWDLPWDCGQRVSGAGMFFKTDALTCLVPGGDDWKAGLSWHKRLSLFSLPVVSEPSICLHGLDLIRGSSGLPGAHTQRLAGPRD